MTDIEIGNASEAENIRILKKHGYTDVVQIQNNSGNGIDVMARAPNGKIRYFETKGSTRPVAGKLSGPQRNRDSFITKRLNEAAQRGTVSQKLLTDSNAQRLAQQAVAEGGSTRGAKFEFTNIGQSSQDSDSILDLFKLYDVKVLPWPPN